MISPIRTSVRHPIPSSTPTICGDRPFLASPAWRVDPVRSRPTQVDAGVRSSWNEPDPTQVIPGGFAASAAGGPPVESYAGGPADPGGPGGYGPGGPFGGGPTGPDDGEYGEPEELALPWWQQPGPIAAMIAGVVALALAFLAIFVFGNDDGGDDELAGISTSSTSSSSTTHHASRRPV